MADTQRTTAAILALLADNTTGDISAQDVRDFAASWRMGHGQIFVPATARAAVTIGDTTNYVECTAPAWTLTAGAHLWGETSNGRLYYTGTVPMVCHVACTFSITSAGSNQIIHLRLGKNTTTDPAAEVQRKIGAGTDVGSSALHLVTTVSTGDYLSLWVRNATNASNVTIETANLQVVSMPI